MKKKAMLGLLGFAVIAVCALSLPAQDKVIPPPNDQQPPIARLHCPDVKVASFRATLVSTQWGDPGVEIPYDKVDLWVTLENAGTLPLPPYYMLGILISRNGETIHSGDLPYSFSAPGSRQKFRFPDSFPHGTTTAYDFKVTVPFRECNPANNQFSFTIDEAKLHPNKNDNPGWQDRRPPPNALTCADVKVVSLQARLLSTQLGDPTIANPYDTIRLEVTLENAGRVEIPAYRMLRSRTLRNGTALNYLENTGLAKAPGTRWTIGYTLSFRHGVPTTIVYQVLSVSDVRECSTNNNELSLAIDEAQLHSPPASKP
ncbi:MAG TPA: hypothetical protein PK919_11630 [Candidatus Aminicenantes bacterium]|nr:hypothetical protein [Candidatus Aminicenantes bacterium]